MGMDKVDEGGPTLLPEGSGEDDNDAPSGVRLVGLTRSKTKGKVGFSNRAARTGGAFPLLPFKMASGTLSGLSERQVMYSAEGGLSVVLGNPASIGRFTVPDIIVVSLRAATAVGGSSVAIVASHEAKVETIGRNMDVSSLRLRPLGTAVPLSTSTSWTSPCDIGVVSGARRGLASCCDRDNRLISRKRIVSSRRPTFKEEAPAKRWNDKKREKGCLLSVLIFIVLRTIESIE